jgi:hypothetical protein
MTRDILRAKLNLETAQLAWPKLERHFARSSVIKVMPGTDLVDTALHVAKNNTAVIQTRLTEGRIARAKMNDADELLRKTQSPQQVGALSAIRSRWCGLFHRAAGIFTAATARSGHAFDRCGQTALVACCLVLVDDLLVGDAVDQAHGCLENLLGSSLVTGFDCLAHFLDRGAVFRTLAHVAVALGAGLTCALTRLGGVRHKILLL